MHILQVRSFVEVGYPSQKITPLLPQPVLSKQSSTGASATGTCFLGTCLSLSCGLPTHEAGKFRLKDTQFLS